MKLTRATATECEAMATAHAEAFHDKAWREDEFEDLLEGEGIYGFLADDGEPLGVILCRVVADEVEVLTVGVPPSVRRRGVARALLLAALDVAREGAVARAFLEVAVDNDGAIALYDRLGFRKTGLRKSYYDRGPEGFVDALVMRLDLNAGAASAYPGRPTRERPVSDRIEKLCVEKGMRMTEQRRVIARVLSEAHDHPDVEELHRRAHAVDPHISIATVYRTVRLFDEAGIITRHDFRDGRSRYEEHPDQHHDHLIDMKTGQVVEFVDAEIEALQEAIARKLGYRLVDHRLELYGMPIEEK